MKELNIILYCVTDFVTLCHSFQINERNCACLPAFSSTGILDFILFDFILYGQNTRTMIFSCMNDASWLLQKNNSITMHLSITGKWIWYSPFLCFLVANYFNSFLVSIFQLAIYFSITKIYGTYVMQIFKQAVIHFSLNSAAVTIMKETKKTPKNSTMFMAHALNSIYM